MIDIDALASHYRGLTDEQLERLTLEELAQLRPEALPVLRQELDLRGKSDLGKAVTAQIEGLRPSEYEALVSWFRSAPCPMCGSEGQPLNACNVETLVHAAVVVGCPKCLQLAVDAASTKNTVGCLFAPLGWAMGPRAQMKNASALLDARGPEPTESFLKFVREHQGPLVIAMRQAQSGRRRGDEVRVASFGEGRRAMGPDSTREPVLLKATALAEADRGTFEWNVGHNADLLTVSNAGRTIEWGPRKPQYTGKHYPPAWVPASTCSRLHSGRFRWDFVIDELAGAQLGVGFMLLWDIGPDWGFFGYLGSSTSAWSYDPSTGDVVYDTESIQGGLPKVSDGRSGVVSVRLDLPRDAAGTGWFAMNGTDSRPITLPEGSVVLPAACFLRESQRVSLSGFGSW